MCVCYVFQRTKFSCFLRKELKYRRIEVVMERGREKSVCKITSTPVDDQDGVTKGRKESGDPR